MNRIWFKDFFREIKKSLNRYLSIFFIVALGVAFFAGVRSSEPDMRMTVDDYLDDMNFMDIRVISTMGLTEEDVEAVMSIKGVTSAEGGYEKDVFCDIYDEEKIIHMMSLPFDTNDTYITDGRLPRKDGECLADVVLAQNFGFETGDTISIRLGDEEDELQEERTYTISGFAMNPFYLTFQRGNANIGNGSISAFIMVDEDEFEQDYYNQVYIRADSLKEQDCYSSEYDDILQEIKGKIEDISGERCIARYESVYESARQELLDGETEYESVSSEAKEQLDAGREEIESAEQEILSGSKELEEAGLQIESAEQEIQSGESQLASGESQLAAKERELNNANVQLDEGEAKLSDTYEKLQAAQQEYNEGMIAIADAKIQYTNGLLEYNNGKNQLDQSKLLLDGSAVLLRTAWEAYDRGIGDFDTLNDLQADYDEKLQEYNEGKIKLESAKAELDAANEEIAANEEKLASAKAELDSGWEQYYAGKAEYNAAKNEAYKGRTQLEAAKDKLEDSKSELVAGRDELEAAKLQYEDSEKLLDDGRKELEAAKEEFRRAEQDAKDSLKEARVKLDDGWEKLDDLKVPEWYVLDRNTLQTYVEYGTDAERMGAIGKVFPVIFFMVAALVCLTTMTRMVEEQRTQIGTFKALGYSTFSIAMKYLLYALSASVGGSILGAVLGGKIIPKVIIMAYGMLYNNIPYSATPINVKYSLMASGTAILCTTVAAVAACYKALRSQSAQLMRPTAPKQGKKVLVERITFIWKHLNFSQKATLRNLFRYKKRLFMTIFGIGACTALLLVGFGLRDGISAILGNQFKRVWLYDATVSVDSDAEAADIEALWKIIDGDEHIETGLTAFVSSMDAQCNGQVKSINLFVPENIEDFEEIISVHDRITGEKFELGDNEVIISEKLSKLLSLSEGDLFSIKESDTSVFEIKVGAIAENYLYHYVYMSPILYQEVFEKAPDYNQILIKAEEGVAGSELPAKEMLDNPAVLSVGIVADTEKTMDKMMSSLDAVVWVLIISAGLLAFVVLYNLNNISITERIRELATIKVLGFYNREVAWYVYRENVLLTLIGTAAGVFFGRYLHQFVLSTAEIDIIMFGKDISLTSYILGIILTIVFAAVINFVMYFRLKKIDMIESLKSVE